MHGSSGAEGLHQLVGAKHASISACPAGLLQVVNQIYWCQEVEEAFAQMKRGDKDAMKVGMGRCAGGWDGWVGGWAEVGSAAAGEVVYSKAQVR